MSKTNIVGNLIAFYRVPRGWDHTDICSFTGIKQARLRSIETNRSKPSLAEFRALAHVLDMPAHAVQTGEDVLQKGEVDPVDRSFPYTHRISLCQ
jgi:transcriptional regulator with XRE-family HTH domain